ncbi:MAG TPA: superoxide dismutase [Oscillospiraceae bacterium]|nr:superoxide dismutase [Oscillospiraceae bacterium]
MDNHYPFELVPLPYGYEALEPNIDTKTMNFHHNRHLKTYVDNLNAALANYPFYQTWNLRKLLMNLTRLPKDIQTAVKNNGGGVYNHNFYFAGMVPSSKSKYSADSSLGKAIEKTFGSYEEFKSQLKKSALSQFGSGYAWLVFTPQRQLRIVNTANQDTVIVQNYRPILTIDVWEHAYYLKYQNKRADYVDNWFNIINWQQAEQNYLVSKSPVYARALR